MFQKVFNNFISPWMFGSLYKIDQTCIQVIPGLLIDIFNKKISQHPSKNEEDLHEKDLLSLKKWGKEHGRVDLKNDFSTLYNGHWYNQHWSLLPFEYLKTSWIITGRKTYFSAIKKIRQKEILSKLHASIQNLAKNSQDLNQETLAKTAKTILEKTQNSFSFLHTLLTAYQEYPNSPTKYWVAWGIRCLPFYYYSPFASRTLSIAWTLTCVYFWTMLLAKGAREDLASIQGPKPFERISLSSATQKAICENHPMASNSFKKDLQTLKIAITSKDPFYLQQHINELQEQIEKKKKRQDLKTPLSDERYLKNLKLSMLKINLYTLQEDGNKKKEEEETLKNNFQILNEKNHLMAQNFWNFLTQEEKNLVSISAPDKKINNRSKILKTT